MNSELLELLYRKYYKRIYLYLFTKMSYVYSHRAFRAYRIVIPHLFIYLA